MNHFYAKAIDILVGSTVDYKAICIELAKQNPELFCDLAAPSRGNSWQKEVVDLVRSNQTVSAIKLCREKTGFGLKEAKDVIDAVRSRDGDYWYNPSHLEERFHVVYKDIISAGKL